MTKTSIHRLAMYKGHLGRATLVVGLGYLFRASTSCQAVLVSYTDPDLLLMALVPQAA